MKTYLNKIHLLFIGLFCILALSGCSNDNEVIEESGLNPLKLEASVNPVVLDIDNMDEEIVAFIWEPAPDKSNEGSTLEEYLFRMDIANNDFETSIPTTAIRENLFYKNFTTRTLNKLISEQWNINPGDEVTLEVRVIARYSNPDKFVQPLVSTISVPIQTKELSGRPLYMTGSAVPGGDDPDNPIGITELLAGEIYYWRGMLDAGEFYFIQTPGIAYPAYKQGEKEDEILYISSENEQAGSFTIQEAGTYSIIINLSAGRIAYEEVIPYDLSIIGTGCNYAEQDYSGRLVWNPYFPHECSITTDLKSGLIRFQIPGVDSDNFAYRPMYPNTYITDPIQNVILMSKPNNRWQILSEHAGTYRITLDTKNNQIKFDKLY